MAPFSDTAFSMEFLCFTTLANYYYKTQRIHRKMRRHKMGSLCDSSLVFLQSVQASTSFYFVCLCWRKHSIKPSRTRRLASTRGHACLHAHMYACECTRASFESKKQSSFTISSCPTAAAHIKAVVPAGERVSTAARPHAWQVELLCCMGCWMGGCGPGRKCKETRVTKRGHVETLTHLCLWTLMMVNVYVCSKQGQEH